MIYSLFKEFYSRIRRFKEPIDLEHSSDLTRLLNYPGKIRGVFFSFFCLVITTSVLAQTNTWDGSGGATWETASSWSLNRVPLATDDVVIPNNFDLTINSAAVCNTFTINGGGDDNFVTINGTNSLTVTGAVIIGGGTGANDDKWLNVNAGTLTCASITTSAPNFISTSEVNATSGTINVSGDITNNGRVDFSGAGTLNLGGNMTGGTFTAGSSVVNLNGSNQTIDAYSFNDLTLINSTSVTVTGAIDIAGDFTLGSGTTFDAGSASHTFAGDIINNGATFISTGTIILDGAAQTIGGTTATDFNNLELANSGTKTFNFSTTIDGLLFINTGVVANLGTFATHTALGLTLGGAGQAAGSWGSSSSAATNTNDTYFAATTGFITTTVVGGTIYYSRQTGNWNNGTIWSTADYGGAPAGTFPSGNDIVNIGGADYTITVNVNSTCGQLNFQSGEANSPTVTISGTNSLTVARNIVMTGAGFFSGDNNTLAVNAGTLSAERLEFNTGIFSGSPTISISTGTVTISGDVIYTGFDNAAITFSGAGRLQLGGDFIDAADLTFTPSTGTVEYNGTANQRIGSLTYYNVQINNSSGAIPGLTLGGDATITNQLTMTQGIVNLDGFTLTLGTTGAASVLSRTASTTTNWMYGGTFTRFWRSGVAVTSSSGNRYGLFPMGTSSASSYRPVAINSPANPTSNNSVSVTHTNATTITDLAPVFNDGGTNIVRKHDAQFVIATAVTGGTYNVAVTMTDLNPSGALADIRLAKSNGATTVTASGTAVVATGSASNPTASRTGVTLANLAGDWRITTTNLSNTPLPVTWLSYDAEYVANERLVQLDWATASELNNSGFYIERSPDGNDFEEIGFIEGHGTTDERHDYSFVDMKVERSSYYRLRQVDFDSQFEYSKWVYVSVVNANDEKNLYIYPNPTAGNFKIGGATGEIYDIMVTSLSGEVIFRLEGTRLVDAEERINNVLANYSKGMYLIRFVNPGFVKTISLIRQ